MNPKPPLSWNTLLNYTARDWHDLLVPAIALGGTVLAGFLVRDILFRVLRRWQARSTTKVADVLIASLRGPIIIWSLIFGIYFAIESASMPDRLEHYLSKSLFALWIISFTVMATHLAGAFVKHYGGRSGGDMPATSLTKNLAQIAAACIGLSILLHHLGISITPILTALGVGGLAVALALQDTLSNLFGGFYITIAGQVRLGDYIKLNTGEEGYVGDISWRSTTLRMLSSNNVIVPNSKLAQAIVTNYYLPEKRMRISVQVEAGYDSDLDHVERVLLEVARQAAAEVPGIAAGEEPSVRLNPGFGDSALQMQLNVHIDEFAQQFVVQHELRKRIFKRFREEKIDMPYPTRTVFLKQ
jgi:small-conductance mechanosensitive channel